MRNLAEIEQQYHGLFNRPLAFVYKQHEDIKIGKYSHDEDRLIFEFQDGTTVKYSAVGDCCSHSWFEHVETPGDISGAHMLDVIEHDTGNGMQTDTFDWLQVYKITFRTTRGDIDVEFRNSSNGYYGGSLELVR